MSIRYKFFILLVLWPVSLLYTKEAIVHANDLKLGRWDAGPALAWVQEVGKEAQLTVGIAPEELVPVRDMSTDYPHRNSRAHVDKHAMYVRYYQYDTPGILRILLLHEAIHLKHKHYLKGWYDIRKRVYIMLGLCLFGVSFTLKKPTWSVLANVLGLTALSIGYTTKSPLYYKERAADVESLHAAQCYECVKVMAERYSISQYDPHFDEICNQKGYLSYEECMERADLFKGKSCIYHASL